MKVVRLVAITLGTLVLTGCGVSGDFDDLRSYMDEVRAKPKGSIEPLPALSPFFAFFVPR